MMHIERSGVDLQSGRVAIYEGKTKAARRKLKLTPESLMIVERRMRDRQRTNTLSEP